MRVLICGGRDYSDRALFERVMEPYRSTATTIIHGACPTGADAMADDWPNAYGQHTERYPADWRTNGSAAGPIRNQRMLDDGQPDLVIAFPGGRGTADMVRRAKAAGVQVIEVSASA